MDNADTRRERLLNKAGEKALAQEGRLLAALAARADCGPALDYFIELMQAGLGPEALAKRVRKPLAALLCVQAPLELLHCFGLHPFKIFSGSYAFGQLAAFDLPAVTCPMLRAVLGALQAAPAGCGATAWILPTTCDWVVKFPEMLDLCRVPRPKNLYWLELPHLKDQERGRKRWLEEIYGLQAFLRGLTGRKPGRKDLLRSIEVYQEAHAAFNRLIDLRREGRVPALWFALISNAFFLDTPERWTQAVTLALPAFAAARPCRSGRVFLAGSPIFFPNYKVLELMEEAGLRVVADDLCSGERIFPGFVTREDPSEYGLLAALAQRYHQGCLCPTFADNDRRVNNIIRPALRPHLDGVVFQALKGCHPYDLESFTLERAVKGRGLKFIRLETDYTAEDGQGLFTRLEAYRQNLEES